MAFVIVVMAQNAHFIASKTFFICQCRFSTAGSSGNSYQYRIHKKLLFIR